MAEKVKWTDEEYDRLADIVFAMRLANPEPPLVTLINQAMGQFSEHRRRKIQAVNNVTPLLARLEVLLAKFRVSQAENESLRGRLVAAETSPDDDEVLRLYGPRVLKHLTPQEILRVHQPSDFLLDISVADLAAETVRRLVLQLLPQQERNVASCECENSPVTPPNNLAVVPIPRSIYHPTVPLAKRKTRTKIVVVGLKPNQQTPFANLLPADAGIECRFIDTNVSPATIPSGAALYVIWTKFASHAMQDKCRSLGDVIACDKLDKIAGLVTQYLQPAG